MPRPSPLNLIAHIADLHRRTMLGMMASLDENVGRVLAKLRDAGLEESTLVFFLSDNGGPTGRARPQPDADFEYGQNTSKNDPCRGVKGDLLEGGIRVPFMVQWKGHIPAGKTYDQPVISLDILPTALAAAAWLLAPLAATSVVAQEKSATDIKQKVQVATYYFPNWGSVAQSEWRSIKAAKPRFEGHAQPKVPVGGYENENDPTVMARKIAAAADHGLDGFIFDWYHHAF